MLGGPTTLKGCDLVDKKKITSWWNKLKDAIRAM